jgi:hypothetical protein
MCIARKAGKDEPVDGFADRSGKELDEAEPDSEHEQEALRDLGSTAI